jgi:hypothetical protein
MVNRIGHRQPDATAPQGPAAYHDHRPKGQGGTALAAGGGKGVAWPTEGPQGQLYTKHFDQP